jgi:hypothetical protein
MARNRIIKTTRKSKRLFATGSTASGDVITTSSFQEASSSFANNVYITDTYLDFPDGTSPIRGLMYVIQEIQEDVEDLHTEISQSVYVEQVNSGSFVSEIKTFTARDTTPSVSGGTLFKTANDRATSISAFDDPTPGQQITILIEDANTDFTNDGAGRTTNGLKLSGAANWTAATTNDSITFVYNGSKWIELSRSDNT